MFSARDFAKNSDKQNARIEHDHALGRVIGDFFEDQSELFKRFYDDPSFKRFISNWVFDNTYRDLDFATFSSLVHAA